MAFYLPLLLVLVVVGVAIVGLAAYSRVNDRVRALEAENRKLRAALEDVKELAWSHRELDSDLSTIIIDSIRSAQRESPPELPG